MFVISASYRSMDRLNKTVKASVILFVFFLSISDVESMKTLKHAAGKTGGSVTIPCFYDKQYKLNPKFWCKGYSWTYCTIVAYANSTGRLSISDLTAQNVFTVELDSLTESDSGWYWCAAEISGITLDDGESLYLTVSRDPGVSVVESRVSGQEGGSVTVQCLYSAAYKNEKKQWCRFKDRRCYGLGKTETSQDSAVHVTDDGKSSFSVQMTGLRKSDAGWYWCSAGDLEAPFHLSIGDEHPGLPDDKHNQDSSSDFTTRILIIVSVILLLLVVIGLVIWKLKQNGAAVINEGRTDTLHPAAEEDITYSSVTCSHHPTVSAVHEKDKVIYSSVKLHH